jgi:hypothetical protein
MIMEGFQEINFKEINREEHNTCPGGRCQGEREGNPLFFLAAFACFAV